MIASSCHVFAMLPLRRGGWLCPRVGQTSKITLGQVTEKNVGAFKMLNNSVLPVSYNDKFYADLVATPHDFTKMGVCAPVRVCVTEIFIAVHAPWPL